MTRAVFAFDRDLTVTVNEGPVPLATVKMLAAADGFDVWAVGNQLLVDEAGIPGVEEMARRAGRHPKDFAPDALPPAGDDDARRFKNRTSKARRLACLETLYGPETALVVVDDYDLAFVPRWLWIAPATFAALPWWVG